MNLRRRCDQHTWRRGIDQNVSVARSLTRMPRTRPNRSSRSVSFWPLGSTLKTVTAVVAMTHNDSSAPARSHVVPSACLIAAARALSHASSTAGSTATPTRFSIALTVPSDIVMSCLSWNVTS